MIIAISKPLPGPLIKSMDLVIDGKVVRCLSLHPKWVGDITNVDGYYDLEVWLLPDYQENDNWQEMLEFAAINNMPVKRLMKVPMFTLVEYREHLKEPRNG